MKAMNDRVLTEAREFTTAEAEAYARLGSKLDICTGRIAELEAGDDAGNRASLEAILGDISGLQHVDPSKGAATQRGGITGRALNVNEGAENVPDAVRQTVAVALEKDDDPSSRLARYVIAAGDPDYATAFRKWLADPISAGHTWTPEERNAAIRAQEEARALGISTGSAGGFLVSYELDPQVLISNVGSVNPLRQIARVELTTQNVTKFVTSAGVTASWDAEAAEVSDDSPTIAQPSITCHTGRAFVPVSFEVFEDSPELGSQIQELFVDAKAQLESSAFTTGSGSGEPKGIITAIAAVPGSVVTSAGSAIALADIVANQNALPPRWRPRGAFMANLSVINAARQIPAGSGLSTSVVDDTTNPPRILGWDVHENSRMDGTIAAGTTDDFVLLSGDFSQYVIADRVGTTVEFVQNLFGENNRPTGQRGFLLHWRTGADALITDAFRLTNYSG